MTTRWRTEWRPGERDALVERGPEDPVIVVRPRTGSEDPQLSAMRMADSIAFWLNGDACCSDGSAACCCPETVND